MFCTNCGKEIPSGAKFCTECGNSANGTPDQQILAAEATDPVQPYPVVEVINAKKVVYAGWGVFSCIIAFQLISNQLSYIGTSDFSPLSLLRWIVVFIVCALLALGCWFSRKEPFYVVQCPYCGSEVQFPTEEQGMDCPCCGKRMIMKDNLIQQIPNTSPQQ